MTNGTWLAWAVAVITPFALLTNIALIYSLFRTSLLHANVRWILANTSLASAVCSIHLGVRSIITSLQWRMETGEERSAQLCMVSEVPFTSALFIVLLSNHCVCMERLSASSTQREATNTDGWFGLFVSFGSWTTTAAISIVMLFISKHQPPVFYCSNLLVQNKTVLNIGCGGLVCSSVLVLGIYALLSRLHSTSLYQFAINKAVTQNLAARFQIKRNIDITRMLMPSVCLQFIGTVTLVICAFFVYRVKTRSIQIQMVHLLHAGLILHSTVYALVLFMTCKSLRRTLLRCFKHSNEREETGENGDEEGRGQKMPKVVTNYRRTPEEIDSIMNNWWQSVNEQ